MEQADWTVKKNEKTFINRINRYDWKQTEQLKKRKRIRDASRYTSKKISLKFLFLSDIFLFPFVRQQIMVLA